MEIEGAAAKSEWVTDLVENPTTFEIKIVGKPDDIESSKGANPEYTHQVVGPSETIVGYKAPKCTIYYSAGKLNTYVSFTHEAVCEDPEGAEPDDVVKMVKEWLPQGSVRSLDEFSAGLDDELSFTPHGEKIYEYTPSNAGDGVTFEIYQGDVTNEQMVEYHKRTEMWLIWYIETASVLDLEDERWQLLHLFERRGVGGEVRYTFAGMLTVCAFYGFPDKIRPRISQMCVVPQFQKRGHGEQLLQQAYTFIMSKFKGKMTDITVEDPSPAFRTMRDRVDCKNCWKAFPTKEFYQQSFAEAAGAIKGKLCLYNDQARRVFEIIQLRLLGTRDPEVLKSYRLKIKTRLYQPHQSMSNNKAFRRFNDEKEDEAQAILIGLTKEDKEGVMSKKDELLTNMAKQFEELTTEYWQVIDRLQMD